MDIVAETPIMTEGKMSVAKYISKDSIVTLHGKNKIEIMDEIIDRAAELSKLDRDLIFRLVWKRERMMTTGVGNGLALPHIRVGNIAEPVIVLGVCGEPVTDYNTQDDKPVKVVVFIIAADSDQEAYLQLLGSISRSMRDAAFIDALSENAVRPTQILKLIQEHTKE